MISRRFGRTAGWGIADQTASSLTNFVLGVFVARESTTEEFGAFALAFVTYLLCLNIERAIVAYPLLIRYSNVPIDRWRAGASEGIAVALALGIAFGSLAFVGGLVAGGELGHAWLGIGLAMPALLVQDAWRFTFVAAGDSRDAFFNDAIRLVFLVPSFGVVVVLDAHAVLAPILAWGLGSAIAAVAGSLRSGVTPEWTTGRGWYGQHSDLIPRFVAESLITVGSLQLTYFLIGAVAGLAAVGAIRAGELLLGPYHVFSLGVMLVVLPEATRMLRRSDAALVRLCLVVSGVLGGLAILIGFVLLFLPDEIGTALLGASFEAARSVLIPLALALAATMAASGGGTGLRALELAGRTLRAGVIMSAALLVAATFGAWTMARSGRHGGS